MTTDASVATGAVTAPKRATKTASKAGKPRAVTAAHSTPASNATAEDAPAPSGTSPAADRIDPPAPGKLDRLAALLADPAGTTIAAMTAATGWQAHSVRGAMAGALRKRGLVVTSTKVDGVRTYRAGPAA